MTRQHYTLDGNSADTVTYDCLAGESFSVLLSRAISTDTTSERVMGWFMANSTSMNIRGNGPRNTEGAAVELLVTRNFDKLGDGI